MEIFSSVNQEKKTETVFSDHLMKTVYDKQFSVPQAFVISFTSDFIPRLVYQYMYSPDGTMHGFINHTLSYFNVTDFQEGTDPIQPMHLGYKVDICR